MTEAEALDMAAKAYGWDNFADAAFFYGPDCTSAPHQIAGIRAHAAALMENAALKAENERLGDLLCLADELLMEAKGAFPLPGSPLREAYLKIREVTGKDYHARKNRARAALKEIDNGDR